MVIEGLLSIIILGVVAWSLWSIGNQTDNMIKKW